MEQLQNAPLWVQILGAGVTVILILVMVERLMRIVRPQPVFNGSTKPIMDQLGIIANNGTLTNTLLNELKEEAKRANEETHSRLERVEGRLVLAMERQVRKDDLRKITQSGRKR